MQYFLRNYTDTIQIPKTKKKFLIYTLCEMCILSSKTKLFKLTSFKIHLICCAEKYWLLYWLCSFTNPQLCRDTVTDSDEHLASLKHVAFSSFHQDFFLQALIHSLISFRYFFKQSLTFISILIKSLLQNRINNLCLSSILPLTPHHVNQDSWTSTINHPSFTLLAKQKKFPPKSLLKRGCFADHAWEVNP